MMVSDFLRKSHQSVSEKRTVHSTTCVTTCAELVDQVLSEAGETTLGVIGADTARASRLCVAVTELGDEGTVCAAVKEFGVAELVAAVA